MTPSIQYSPDGKCLIKCPNIYTHVIIPDGVIGIGYHAFENCSNLQSVTIPSSVTGIDDNAFAECINLKTIVIPNGVTRIGRKAFMSCKELSSIIIPESVTEIGEGAFNYCYKLSTLIIPDSSSSKVTRGFWDLAWGGMSSLPINDDLVYADTFLLTRRHYNFDADRVSFSIKDGTRIIGPNVFSYSHIVTITIPKSVIRIGAGAFSHCNYITSLKLPKSLKSIEDSTFEGSHSLKSIVVPEGVQSIGQRAFYDCTLLSDISLPKSITKIEQDAFARCKSLESVTIPYGVEKISEKTFLLCTNLKSIKLPNSLTRIDNEAFCECSSLKSITLPEGVTRIDKRVFCRCKSLETIYLPESIVMIGPGVFDECDNIKEIVIPRGLREKFLQFKPLEEYKFLIREDQNSRNSDFDEDNNCSPIDMVNGISILNHYAQKAEKENKIEYAISLYEDAEKLGSAEASYRLGLILVDKDFYKGYYHMKIAADAGFSDALIILKKFELKRP